MFIDYLQLALTEKELNILVGKYLPADLPITSLKISLVEDHIMLTGNAKKVVNVPFTALIKISEKGASTIGLKITKIEAVGPVGNMLRGLIWNIVLKLLPTKKGVRAYGNRLRLNLDDLLSYWNIPTQVEFKSISVGPGVLKMELSGNLNPPQSLEKYLDLSQGGREPIV